MKHRFINAVATGLLATVFLLGTGATHAATVIFGDPQNPTKATEIEDLNVGGTLYDLTFRVAVTAATVYGAYPGNFTFTSKNVAGAARDAINAALNADGALSVGEVGPESAEFNIGYKSFDKGVEELYTATGAFQRTSWDNLGFSAVAYADKETYAVFTQADGPPPTKPPPSSSAPRFINKTVTCPKIGVTLVPADASPTTVKGISITSNATVSVLIKFNPPLKELMSVNIKANQTVVSNFSGVIESQEGQGLKLDCQGSATISVGIKGLGTL